MSRDYETLYYEQQASFTESNGMLTAENESLRKRLSEAQSRLDLFALDADQYSMADKVQDAENERDWAEEKLSEAQTLIEDCRHDIKGLQAECDEAGAYAIQCREALRRAVNLLSREALVGAGHEQRQEWRKLTDGGPDTPLTEHVSTVWTCIHCGTEEREVDGIVNHTCPAIRTTPSSWPVREEK